MKKLKYSDKLYVVIRQFLSGCPVCPKGLPAQKNVTLKIPKCSIYRTSDSSVTMQCSRCGLHFTITWKSLAEAIGQNADTIAERGGDEKQYGNYAEAFETLEKNVNIGGVIRSTPKQQLLNKLLKAKLK